MRNETRDSFQTTAQAGWCHRQAQRGSQQTETFSLPFAATGRRGAGLIRVTKPL